MYLNIAFPGGSTPDVARPSIDRRVTRTLGGAERLPRVAPRRANVTISAQNYKLKRIRSAGPAPLLGNLRFSGFRELPHVQAYPDTFKNHDARCIESGPPLFTSALAVYRRPLL